MRVELPVCQACDGKGGWDQFSAQVQKTLWHPCSSCGGSGWNITDELAWKAGVSDLDHRSNQYKPDRIKNGRKRLVAVFDYLKENQT